MSAQENHVPSPPTWREYLDARLAPMATKDDLRELERRTNDKMDALRTSMRNWLVLGFAVLAALITFFGVMNQPPQ